MKKKFLAGLLSLAMMLTLLPVGAFAAEGGPSITLKFYADGAKANAVTTSTKDDSERDTLILDINPGTIPNSDKYVAAISYPSEANHTYTTEEGVKVGSTESANYELLTGELSEAGQYYISLNPWSDGKQQYKGIVADKEYTVSLLKKTTSGSDVTYALVDGASATFTLKETTINFGEGATPTSIIKQHEDKGSEYFYRVDGTSAKIYALTDIPEADSADALTALQKLISFEDGSDYADATKGTWAFTASTNTFTWTAKEPATPAITGVTSNTSGVTATWGENKVTLGGELAAPETGTEGTVNLTFTYTDADEAEQTADAAVTLTYTAADGSTPASWTIPAEVTVDGDLKAALTGTVDVAVQLADLDLTGIFAATLHDTRVGTDNANAVADEDLYAADSYKVTATSEGQAVAVKFAATDLKQHQNGDDPQDLGYWVGVAVPAPAEGVNAFQRKIKKADNTDEVTNAALEDIAAGTKGFTFYLNAANPRTTEFTLSFGNLADDVYTPVTEAYTFTLDFTDVKLYTTATATAPEEGETTATVDSTVAENLVKDVISAAEGNTGNVNEGEGEEAKPTVTIDASAATGATAVTIPAAAVTVLTGDDAAAVTDLTVKVALPNATVALPASALPENTTEALTVSVAPNDTVKDNTDLTADDKVEAHDIEVKKGTDTDPVRVEGDITVSVATAFEATVASDLTVVYFPDTGKPSVIDTDVSIEGTTATFTVPHLSTYALMLADTAAKLDLDETVTVKYQIGSNEETLTGTSAAVTVGAAVEDIKITVEGTIKTITVNGEAYTSGGNTVALTEGANTITIVVGDQTYTLTVTRESAVTPPTPGLTELTADNFLYTPYSKMSASDKAIYYGGKLTINGLDPTKTYVVTYEHSNANSSTMPRIAHVVQNPTAGSVSLSCQRSMTILVFEVVGTDITAEGGLEYIFGRTTGNKGTPVTAFEKP